MKSVFVFIATGFLTVPPFFKINAKYRQANREDVMFIGYRAGKLTRDSIQNVIIKGKVIIKDDREPIPGASIKVKGTDVTAKTDNTGTFILKITPMDTHIVYLNNIVLVIKCVGFETQEVLIPLHKKKKLYTIKMRHVALFYQGE